MEISIKVDGLDRVDKSIKELGRQFPVAVAKALTFTAERVKARLGQEMNTVFDRPTPYTLNSLYLKTATQNDLTAAVFMKDNTSSARLPVNWLGPEIFGGDRKRKAFERALLFHGVMNTQRAYAMPGANAELDRYGNMSKGQINRMLSYFQAAENRAGYKANTSAEKKAKLAKGTRSSLGITYFAIKSQKGHLAPGIYSKVANRIKPVLIFTKKPSYKPRFHFYKIGEETVNKVWPAILHERIDKEIQRLALK
jgi:hypothetical protein